MADWYVDRGLAKLIGQWREAHPGAVVGTIGDPAHQGTDSDHNPEADGSVDAGDFMPGASVSQADLDEFAEMLRAHRDPRIAYVIRRQRIFSSTISPWQWRSYSGAYHGHTHVSVNDRHENDTTPWEGFDMALTDDDAQKVVDRLMAHSVTMTGRPAVNVRDLLKQGLPAKEAAETARDGVAELVARPAAGSIDVGALAAAIVSLLPPTALTAAEVETAVANVLLRGVGNTPAAG